LLQLLAQHITGPTCCHWLVLDTPAAAASAAAPPSQLITQELLAKQCARQQLQRVLQDALTIKVSSTTNSTSGSVTLFQPSQSSVSCEFDFTSNVPDTCLEHANAHAVFSAGISS
jgi:hypothetical protein